MLQRCMILLWESSSSLLFSTSIACLGCRGLCVQMQQCFHCWCNGNYVHLSERPGINRNSPQDPQKGFVCLLLALHCFWPLSKLEQRQYRGWRRRDRCFVLLEVSMGGFKSSIVTQDTTVRLVPYKMNTVKVLGKGTIFYERDWYKCKKKNQTQKTQTE